MGITKYKEVYQNLLMIQMCYMTELNDNPRQNGPCMSDGYGHIGEVNSKTNNGSRWKNLNI